MSYKNKNNSLASNQSKPGSPENGEPVFLSIGKLRRSHGLNGDILMDVATHFPERIVKGKKIFVGEDHQEETIENVRTANKNIIIKLASVNSPEDVVPYRNQTVYISTDGLPELPDGEYYHHELIGLSVVTDNNEMVGVISEILETGANDVYIVKTPDNNEVLIPVVFEYVLEYLLDEGKIRVRLPDIE
jgi:16S rRNA processing protein RimM